jgi:hypothetical protein
MLISTSHQFVFVANLKTGSSAIERALRRHADIAVRETRLGKHLPLEQIEKRFAWLFQHYPIESLFVFGVMREPVDYMLSLYNAHSETPEGAKRPSTRGQPFDAFVREWSAESWQARPQREMFLRDGRVAVDALIDFRHLAPQFAAICHEIGAQAKLVVSNASPKTMLREAVDPDTIRFIEAHYAEDYAFYERYAGRMRREDVWSPIPPPPPEPEAAPPPAPAADAAAAPASAPAPATPPPPEPRKGLLRAVLRPVIGR